MEPKKLYEGMVFAATFEGDTYKQVLVLADSVQAALLALGLYLPDIKNCKLTKVEKQPWVLGMIV